MMEKERDMFEFTKLESLKNEIIERLTAIVNEEGTLGLVGKQIKELLLEFYREAGEAINEITQDYKHDLDFYGGPWALQKKGAEEWISKNKYSWENNTALRHLKQESIDDITATILRQMTQVGSHILFQCGNSYKLLQGFGLLSDENQENFLNTLEKQADKDNKERIKKYK